MRSTTISRPKEAEPRFRLPDGTRSVQSPWIWRGFFFLSLVAFGLFLSFVTEGKGFLSIAWAFIGLGWFSISMWLWRKNVLLDRETYRAPVRRK